MNPCSRKGQISVSLVIGAAVIILGAIALGAEEKQGEAASKATIDAIPERQVETSVVLANDSTQ